MSRDGERISAGVTEVRLDRDLPGIVRKPGGAPGYVDIELAPERVQELAGPTIDGPRQDTGQARYMLGGRIRFVRLRERREAAGLTVADLAEASTLPVAVLEAIEAEDEIATDRDMRLIAGALGCEVDDAFPWSVPFGPAPTEKAAEARAATPPPVDRNAPRRTADQVAAAEEDKRQGLLAEVGEARKDVERAGLREAVSDLAKKLRR